MYGKSFFATLSFRPFILWYLSRWFPSIVDDARAVLLHYVVIPLMKSTHHLLKLVLLLFIDILEDAPSVEAAAAVTVVPWDCGARIFIVHHRHNVSGKMSLHRKRRRNPGVKGRLRWQKCHASTSANRRSQVDDLSRFHLMYNWIGSFTRLFFDLGILPCCFKTTRFPKWTCLSSDTFPI